MKLLSIDPSSTAVGVYDGVTPCTWYFEGDRKERLGDFMSLLDGFLRRARDTTGQFDFIVFETAIRRGKDATRCLWGVSGILEAIAYANGVGTIDIDNNTLRKWATGSGRKFVKNKASEENPMFVKAREFVSLEFWNTMTDHEADAICLYHYLLEKGITGHGTE